MNPSKTIRKTRLLCAVILVCASWAANALEIPGMDDFPNIGANAITMDLTMLENRVRDTKAIGALKKLALKGEIDDLLGKFRTYYRTEGGTPVALRKPYEQLLDKVATALRDKDPALAKAIEASRSSIWAALSDSAKFASLD